MSKWKHIISVILILSLISPTSFAANIGPKAPDTNANTICSGTSTYLDGEGNCDTLSLILDKLDATTAPTVDDDSDDGYEVGSAWIDVTGDDEYVLVDATVGAAVWLETTRRSILTAGTFPASGDFTGQKLRASTGDYSNRDITYEWTGSVWQPKESSGDVAFYVDSTDGTDSAEMGFGVDGDAFETLQYSIDQIPGIVGGYVTINVNDETYIENVIIQGKTFTGAFTITLQGTLSLQETVTSATVAQGDATTKGTVTDTEFSGDAYDNLLAYFEDVGDLEYRLVDSQSGNVLTLVGKAPSSTTQSVSIYGWGTKIDPASGNALTVQKGQKGIVFKDIEFADVIQVIDFCQVDLERCFVNQARVFYQVNVGGTITHSYIDSSGVTGGLYASQSSSLLILRSKFWEDNDIRWGVIAQNMSYIVLRGSTIRNYNRGIYSWGNSWIDLNHSAERTFVEQCDTGIYAEKGGIILENSKVQYDSNGTDETEDTGTSGHIL